MYFNDPASARVLRNGHVTEARQARTPRTPASTEPSPVQRLMARLRRTLRIAAERRQPAAEVAVDPTHELFVGLDPEQLARLEQLLTIIEVPSGRSLGRQGTAVREFVTILEGRVGVTIDGIPHAVLDDGSHFGAMPLLSDELGAGHCASFDVMTPSRIAVSTAGDFHAMLAEFPLVAQRVHAMTDVRRAYLAGLSNAPTTAAYPVHTVDLVDAV